MSSNNDIPRHRSPTIDAAPEKVRRVALEAASVTPLAAGAALRSHHEPAEGLVLAVDMFD